MIEILFAVYAFAIILLCLFSLEIKKTTLSRTCQLIEKQYYWRFMYISVCLFNPTSNVSQANRKKLIQLDAYMSCGAWQKL